jgi:hypothetical protein
MHAYTFDGEGTVTQIDGGSSAAFTYLRRMKGCAEVQSTHILDPLNGSCRDRTDLFNGHSILAPLHWIVDVGIGNLPGVNLDFEY